MKNVAKTGKFPRVRSREEQLVFYNRVNYVHYTGIVNISF